MSGFQIKQIALQEINDLQKISKETFFETYAAGNTDEDMKRYLDEEFASDKLTSELKDQNSEFYFAIFDNEIVGYLKINFGQSQTDIHDKKSLEIQRIYVLNEYQGMRIGKLLYQKAVEIAKQKKLDYIWLGVWEENPKAIQFYEKVGFIAFDNHVFKLGEDLQTDIMMKQYVI